MRKPRNPKTPAPIMIRDFRIPSVFGPAPYYGLSELRAWRKAQDDKWSDAGFRRSVQEASARLADLDPGEDIPDPGDRALWLD